jgi:hypothetical protein
MEMMHATSCSNVVVKPSSDSSKSATQLVLQQCRCGGSPGDQNGFYPGHASILARTQINYSTSMQW